MALLKLTSPHAHTAQSTADVMKLVLLATIPGLVALTVFFGWGAIINVVISLCITALSLRSQRDALYASAPLCFI